MKLVIQRVKAASVTLPDGTVTGKIGEGLLIFLGVGEGDTEEMVERYTDKLIRLRIFCDEEGKTNRSIADVDGDFLVVSQFTLYADCKKGNRPSFTQAAAPDRAEELYEYFKRRLQEKYGAEHPDKRVECGSFGADMRVDIVNDGPFTILWDSREW